MIQKFEKFEAILAKIQSIFFCIVLGFMAIVMFASVIFRYVLNDPIIWSEELTTVMQGAGLCRRWLLLPLQGTHPRAAFPR